MAAKVETLGINIRTTSRRHGFVTKIAGAAKRWAERGQLGPSAEDEMRLYTGAR